MDADRATFTAMADGTPEDWKTIAGHSFPSPRPGAGASWITCACWRAIMAAFPSIGSSIRSRPPPVPIATDGPTTMS